MTYPAVTAAYAGVLGLIFALLSAWVVMGRARYAIHHGDGGDPRLNRRIRAHGNFAEYVPLLLVMAAMLEAGEVIEPSLLHGGLAALVFARLVHPLGMLTPTASVWQYLLRATTSSLTWFLLIGASGMLIQAAF